MRWFERQLERLRSLDQLVVDGVLAIVMFAVALLSLFNQDLTEGMTEPTGASVLTALAVSLPVVFRRRAPLPALVVSTVAIFVHVAADWPEGSLPFTVMLLTFTVGAWEAPRRAAVGLGVVFAALVGLGFTDTAGLDTLGVVSNIAFFTVAWSIGVAIRARREAVDARLREAEERANVERQSAARALAEERLRIAQELHDVVAHSMSVIAVQAGVGAHVLDDRPREARAALEAISATSRGALTEMRRLLGVLRSSDGTRSDAPAPGLADLPQLVEDVRNVGVPVTLEIVGSSTTPHPGVELSAYRVVQEALTNVIKHAGSPTRVDVRVQHRPGSLSVEVVDDGRGAASVATEHNGAESLGHGLVGMRERVEVWGGVLSAGPVAGGGYRVRASLPYGDDT